MGLVFLFVFVLDFGRALGFTRSGSFAPPVSRFHSSKVSFEIFPCTKSSANFLRCAWLLKGIYFSAVDVEGSGTAGAPAYPAPADAQRSIGFERIA